MKKVSVVVATYRRKQDLQRALVSLAEQNYADMEIVLVDDNGDAAWNARVSAVVEEFKANFPNVALQYIVNQPNQGSAKSRNIGIAAATGEYVTFLDGDDVYLPDSEETAAESAEMKKRLEREARRTCIRGESKNAYYRSFRDAVT